MLRHLYNQIVTDSTLDKRQSIPLQPQQPQQPAQEAQQPAPTTTGSVAKSLDPDSTFGTEFGALGLDMIFGGAAGISTGVSFDTVFDAVEIHDQFVQDRFGNEHVPKPKQEDPRLWVQPQPGTPEITP